MNKVMSKGITAFVIVTIALSGFSCSREKSAEKKPPDLQRKYLKRIDESTKVAVAKVNGVVLTMNDLISGMNEAARKYAKDPKDITPEIEQKVRKEAFDILIFRELAVQKAIRQGIKVPPEQVNNMLMQLKASAGSEEVFKKNLELAWMTEESLRKKIERDMLFNLIVEKEIFPKIHVDEKRLREAYEKNKNKYNTPETLEIEDLVIVKRGDDAAMMNKAKDLLSQIKKNNKDLSKLQQDGTFLVRQGSITREEYPKLFEGLVKMKPGSLSDVIREEDGLHIVKVMKRAPARQMSFEEAHPWIESELKRPLIEKRTQEWEAELRKGAKIEIIPLKDSQKPTLVH
jgi:peptidyl-prolyl cis-trans isomerase C